MNPYDRLTDSLPISRRMVIMNTGLAAVAVAGLTSCTNYSTTPVDQPSAAGSGPSSAAGPLTVKEADIPVGGGKIFPGDHSTQEGRLQSIQRSLYASGLCGGYHHHHDQLPLPRQQILDCRRIGGESSCT